MTLRKRLFWLFAPLLLFALGFAYLLSQSLILSRFDRQDTAQLTAEAERLRALLDNSPVSYTHLTLPTNREV